MAGLSFRDDADGVFSAVAGLAHAKLALIADDACAAITAGLRADAARRRRHRGGLRREAVGRPRRGRLRDHVLSPRGRPPASSAPFPEAAPRPALARQPRPGPGDPGRRARSFSS